MMHNSHKKILGIITARGGSKGIPGKNIKELAGKPLIAYTIEAAKESGIFDRIILSTDDEKIVNIASIYGCEVPFIRPVELATDTASHFLVIKHAITWLQEHEGYSPDLVMILQPTSPLRTSQHIKEAVALFNENNADSLVSVCEVPGHFHPRWQFTMDNTSHLTIFTGETFDKIVRRRQDLSATYARNGAIYLFKTHLLFDPLNPSFYGTRVAAYIMPISESVNIDSINDWDRAERIMQKRIQ